MCPARIGRLRKRNKPFPSGYKANNVSKSLTPGEPNKLTEDDWERLRPQLESFKGTTAAIAEAVLVRGLSKSEAAREYGTSPQNVSQAVKRVTAHLNGYPPQWELVQVMLDPENAAYVRKLARDEKAKLEQGKK
jgi:DNA-directed RNA polymerase specialized sigma24 family protein